MKRLVRTALAAALLIGLAACGSGGSKSSSQMSDAELLALGQELAQCIRDHGVPSFPDPTVRDGTLQMAQDQPADAVDNAMKACQSIMNKIPQSADKDAVSQSDVVKLRKWAQCLRENGVPEWPDPKSDGSFPIKGTPLDGKTEALQRARQACKQYWDKGWSVS